MPRGGDDASGVAPCRGPHETFGGIPDCCVGHGAHPWVCISGVWMAGCAGYGGRRHFGADRCKADRCSVRALRWHLQLAGTPMTYLWIQSLHIGAALVFTGGLMLLAVVVSGGSLEGGVLLPCEKRIGFAVLQWDRRVTVPALAIVWATGLGLAVWGGWLSQGWLTGKIGLVVALSAMHGILTATLRKRMENEVPPKSSWLRYSPAAVAVCLVAIAVLVTVKP